MYSKFNLYNRSNICSYEYFNNSSQFININCLQHRNKLIKLKLFYRSDCRHNADAIFSTVCAPYGEKLANVSNGYTLRLNV